MPGTRLLRFLALQGESLELENALSDLTMPSSFLLIYPLPHQTLNMAGITCYNVTKWCKRQEMEEYITCLVSDGKRKLHSRCIFYPQMSVINCRREISRVSTGKCAESPFLKFKCASFKSPQTTAVSSL